MLEPARIPGDPLAVVAKLPAGVDVLLRGHDAAGRAALARRLARLCRMQGRRLLIAGDVRLAARMGADGLHLGEARARRRGPRRGPGARWLLSVAAHSPNALARAKRIGADLVLLSPVFPTRTHPGAPSLGPHRFARLASSNVGRSLRILALGGIDARSVRRLPPGVAGIAAIDGWLERARRGPTLRN